MQIDEGVLRRWVRDQLSTVERKEVNMWLLRNADQQVPVMLHALVVEWSDERRDAELAGGGGVGAALASAWSWLMDVGHARWDPLAPQLVLNALGEQVAEVTPLSLSETDDAGSVLVNVSLERDSWLVLFVSDDLGSGSRVLLRPSQLSSGVHSAVARCTALHGQGRVTIWLFTGAACPPVTLPDCIALGRAGRLTVRATRWAAP